MDGHLNKGFHQEVFRGKDVGDFEEDAEPRKSWRKLMVIFSKVDLNTDRRISAKEMQNWAVQKTAGHFRRLLPRAGRTSEPWALMVTATYLGMGTR